MMSFSYVVKIVESLNVADSDLSNVDAQRASRPRAGTARTAPI